MFLTAGNKNIAFDKAFCDSIYQSFFLIHEWPTNINLYEFFLNQDDRNILKEIHEFEDLNQINFKLIKKVINEEKSNYESNLKLKFTSHNKGKITVNHTQHSLIKLKVDIGSPELDKNHSNYYYYPSLDAIKKNFLDYFDTLKRSKLWEGKKELDNLFLTNIELLMNQESKLTKSAEYNFKVEKIKKIQLELDKLNKSYNARHGERREVE